MCRAMYKCIYGATESSPWPRESRSSGTLAWSRQSSQTQYNVHVDVCKLPTPSRFRVQQTSALASRPAGRPLRRAPAGTAMHCSHVSCIAWHMRAPHAIPGRTPLRSPRPSEHQHWPHNNPHACSAASNAPAGRPRDPSATSNTFLPADGALAPTAASLANSCSRRPLLLLSRTYCVCQAKRVTPSTLLSPPRHHRPARSHCQCCQ